MRFLIALVVMIALGCCGPTDSKPCRFVHPDTGELMALHINLGGTNWPARDQWFHPIPGKQQAVFDLYVWNTSGEYVFDGDLWIGFEYPKGSGVQWSGPHSIRAWEKPGQPKEPVGSRWAFGQAEFLFETDKHIKTGWNLFAEWRDGSRSCEIKLTRG